MPSIDTKQVAKEIEIAIQRQFEQGSSESICEILEPVAGNSFYFWQQVTSKLHQQKKYYDSLECWCKADLHFNVSKQDEFDWYFDSVRALIDSSNQTNDPLFFEKALEICKKLMSKGFDEDVWNITIELLIELKSESNKILALIEEIFINQSKLTAYVPSEIFGLKKVDYIESLSGVAEYYLYLDQPSEALRVWSLALKNNSDNFRDEICNAIYMLNNYALERGFDDEEFLPSNFERAQ